MSTASPQASATAAATPTTPPSSSPIKISSSPNPSPTETTPPREDTTTWPKASTSSTTPQCSPNAQPNTASATTPTARASSSSPASGSSPSSSSAPSPRRVKLYRLKDDQWLDLGTGNCVGHFIEGAVTTIAASVHSTVPQEDGAWIIVTREAEEGKEGEVLLRTRIQPYPPGYLSDDEDEDELDGEAREGKVLDIGGYQRQQDTLIVWTEKELDLEMALSFATTGGCGEIWEFIKAARKFSGALSSLVGCAELTGAPPQPTNPSPPLPTLPPSPPLSTSPSTPSRPPSSQNRRSATSTRSRRLSSRSGGQQ